MRNRQRSSCVFMDRRLSCSWPSSRVEDQDLHRLCETQRVLESSFIESGGSGEGVNTSQPRDGLLLLPQNVSKVTESKGAG